MSDKNTPDFLKFLISDGLIKKADILKTSDGFFMVYSSLAGILGKNNIIDFPDSVGERLLCDRFFDDWFLYAVPNGKDYTYSLLKLREQEYDTEDGTPADGDTPGVTISFISFACEILLNCLENPTDENRKKLGVEINRVVSLRGQRHHKSLKKYFKNPKSQGAYLVAETYVKHIVSCARNNCVATPEHYKEIVQQSISYKNSARLLRLPLFIEDLNYKSGRIVCDNENIYIKDLNEYEAMAILATHTGNTSIYSFVAEVEYHARFLTPLAKIKIPFFGRSIYDSAIRADMTVGNSEREGMAPFYSSDSKIVKRQYELHKGSKFQFDVSKIYF